MNVVRNIELHLLEVGPPGAHVLPVGTHNQKMASSAQQTHMAARQPIKQL